MTLPLTGTLEASDINVELGRSATATFSITDAATGVYGAINTCSPYYPNASAPHAYSEWYGYNHNAPCLNSNFAFWDDISTSSENMLYSLSKTYSTVVSSSRPSPRGAMTISFWMKMVYNDQVRGGIMQLASTVGSTQKMTLQWDTLPNSSVPGLFDAVMAFSYTDASNNTVQSRANFTDFNNASLTGISDSTYWNDGNRGYVDTNGYSLITIVIDYASYGTAAYAKWYWNDTLLEVPWQNGAANNASYTFGSTFSAPTWTNTRLYVGGFAVSPALSAKSQLDGFAVFINTAITPTDVTVLYNSGAVAPLSSYQNISTELLFYNFEINTPDMGTETGGAYNMYLDPYNNPKRIQDPAA